jgi:hypothetical protein
MTMSRILAQPSPSAAELLLIAVIRYVHSYSPYHKLVSSVCYLMACHATELKQLALAECCHSQPRRLSAAICCKARAVMAYAVVSS